METGGSRSLASIGKEVLVKGRADSSKKGYGNSSYCEWSLETEVESPSMPAVQIWQKRVEKGETKFQSVSSPVIVEKKTDSAWRLTFTESDLSENPCSERTYIISQNR